jgi:hypothetical protein
MSSLRYYYVINNRGHVKAYGPFQTEREIYFAGYLNKSVTDRDVAARDGRLSVHMMMGVSGFDDREIAAVKAYPEEYGYKSFRLMGARSLPVHSSWKSFSEDFVHELFDKDFELSRPPRR